MPVAARRELRERFFDTLCRGNMCLLWQLKEILHDLPMTAILDVGAGLRVSMNICLPEGVRRATAVGTDRRTLAGLADEFNDGRVATIGGPFEEAIAGAPSFDVAYFIMSLPWLDEPAGAMEAVAARAPECIVVSYPRFAPGELDAVAALFPGDEEAFHDTMDAFTVQVPDVDARLSALGYYPLVVYHSPAWEPLPRHWLRTVLYTPELPDRVPYDRARYIVQVNGKCSHNCPSCYVVKTDETMDAALFRGLLDTVNPGEIVCLRGGEPTLSDNLIPDFIEPALARGIHVIVESNGAFMTSRRYGEYLDVLARDNIEIRLSLDREHYDFFPEHMQRQRIDLVSRFIDDATRRRIVFGLYTLGMTRGQRRAFLARFGVESWERHIRPLTRYSRIRDLPIRGQYVDIRGEIHDTMSGKYIRRTVYASYSDVLADQVAGITV